MPRHFPPPKWVKMERLSNRVFESRFALELRWTSAPVQRRAPSDPALRADKGRSALATPVPADGDGLVLRKGLERTSGPHKPFVTSSYLRVQGPFAHHRHIMIGALAAADLPKGPAVALMPATGFGRPCGMLRSACRGQRDPRGTRVAGRIHGTGPDLTSGI